MINDKSKYKEDKAFLGKCFESFSIKFRNLLKPETDKEKKTLNYYWGIVNGNKCRLFLVSTVKSILTLDNITEEQDIKKMSKFEDKVGYYVFVMEGVLDISDNANFIFVFNKVNKRSKKRDAINLAHKLWSKEFYPGDEYVPYCKKIKRNISDERKADLQEKAKKMFQTLAEKKTVDCPRCDHQFVKLSKSIMADCPSCKTRFFVGERKALTT